MKRLISFLFLTIVFSGIVSGCIDINTPSAEGLDEMLTKYAIGELNFTPACSFDLLNSQLRVMKLYLEILGEIACLENIEL